MIYRADTIPTENHFDAFQRRPGLEFQVSDLLFSEKKLQRGNITCYQGARNVCITPRTISDIRSQLGGFCLWSVDQRPRWFLCMSEHARKELTLVACVPPAGPAEIFAAGSQITSLCNMGTRNKYSSTLFSAHSYFFVFMSMSCVLHGPPTSPSPICSP
jgi:hypothetical protein